MIEHQEGCTIEEIFNQKGEPYFREVENTIIKELVPKQGVIIDCGGGIVLNPINMDLLKQHGIIFYLKASPEVIFQRIKNEKHRPLLNTPDPLGRIGELLNQRIPLYNQAHHIIDANDASIQSPVDEIIRLMAI